ncbi:Uncharacterised protein [Mycobacteroides abscessus subsp. abscessus]|nr:Uncharacterised protein [Mycobacteroides abscessus subsp. abscessus]
MPAQIGQLGGHLDSCQARTHHGDLNIGAGRFQRYAQALCRFEFRERISEFRETGYAGGRRVSAADRVDEVVVVENIPRFQPDQPGGCVDPHGAVDNQTHPLSQHRGVLGGGDTGACRELVKPQPVDELFPRVDEGDVDIRVLLEAVCRHRSGVTAAEDDNVRVLVGHVGLPSSGG